MNSPKVTVLMPVYNEADWLSVSIPSILQQAYEDFEFLIIDDGSSDETLENLQKWKKKDNRIRIISRANRGLPYTLNEGISESNGEYIARMDADNEAHPTRIKKQVECLDKNSQYALVGSWKKNVYDEEETTIRLPVSDYDIKSSLIRTCPIAHSSILARKNVLKEYKYRNMQSEDYDLWVRLASEHSMKNIPEPLTKEYYRKDSITMQRNIIQTLKDLSKIRLNALKLEETPWYKSVYLAAPLLETILPETILRQYVRVKMNLSKQ